MTNELVGPTDSISADNASSRKFGERLRKVWSGSGLKQDEFARSLDVHPATLNNYLQGKRLPGADFVERLAIKYGVNPNWLILGQLPAYAGERTEQVEATCESPCEAPLDRIIATSDVDLVQVPKVKARLSAGNGSFEVNGEIERYYAFRSDWLRHKGNVSTMVLMDVSGESMQPMIMDGDTILIDQSQTELIPGRLYAIGVEGLVYVKRVETKPGQLILKSENPDYDPIIVDTREDLSTVVRILGRMIWLCREAK